MLISLSDVTLPSLAAAAVDEAPARLFVELAAARLLKRGLALWVDSGHGATVRPSPCLGSGVRGEGRGNVIRARVGSGVGDT